MHLAHRTLWTNWPFSITLTVWRLGRNVRWVAFFDQGRLRPNVVVLPQCAHFAIFYILSRLILHCIPESTSSQENC